MVTISLCMIVKNEEDTLARCLGSIREAVDEIIIVDTGSTDATVSIAREYTDHVYFFEWIDDFSAARNFSLEKGTGDFLMWLDADDVLAAEDLPRLLTLKASLTGDTGTVMMPYHVGFDPSGNVTLSYYRERIVNRKNHPRFEGAIHEAIPPTAPVVYWDVPVQHRKIHPSDPNRNLRIFEKLLADGKTLVPREQYYYGRELCDHGRYEEAITVLSAYLEENLGWIEDKISACLKLSQCREALGQNAAALDSLMISFRYDRPRPEVCCQIGRLFLEQALLGPAIFWYETALSFPWREHRHGFIQPDSYGYIPLLQLCLCYDRLGDHKQARAYNERAGKLKPQDPSYLHNKAYFDGLLGSEGDDSQ